MRKFQRYFVLPLICALSACQSGQVEYKYPQKINGKYEMLTQKEAEELNDTVFDKKYLTFDFNERKENKPESEKKVEIRTEDKETVSEQKPLWKNVLPVLSRYPIADIHQDSLIMTEWFSDSENPDRQLKVNVVKVGENAEITVLCRQKEKNGEWINQKNDATLADKIKNDIVNRSLNHN